MCGPNKRIFCVASCLSMIQAIIWTGLAVVGALVYLGKITVQPYQNSSDFFRVTLVKLYFEGPNNKINGSYLGKFGDDYRNPNVIDLIWPDKVFALMVTYVIIHVFYFFSSSLLFLNRNPKKPHECRRLLDVALSWSCITLLLCAIDLMFAYFLVRDFLQILDYTNSKCAFRELVSSSDCKNISELIFIPFSMTLISGRMLILWAWNIYIACYFLLYYKKILNEFHQTDNHQAENKSSQCTKSPPRSTRINLKPKRTVVVVNKPSEKEREQEQKVADLSKPPQVLTPCIKLINESYSTSCDMGNDNDSIRVKQSMEGITRFSDVDAGETTDSVNSSFNPQQVCSRRALTWYTTTNSNNYYGNVGYESDGSITIEQTPDSNPNCETKILKPPIGKPVSIPIPPSVIVSESCSLKDD